MSGPDLVARALGLYTLLPTDEAAREVAGAVAADAELLPRVQAYLAARRGGLRPLELTPHDFAEAAHHVVLGRLRRAA